MGIWKINLIKNISKLLIFVLLVFSAQLFILNPKFVKAGAVSENNGTVTIHEDLNPSNYVIDPNGRVWGNETDSTTGFRNPPNINVKGKDLIVDGSSITVTFSGDQIDLNSLTVKNDATVTHAGPGADGTHYNNQDLMLDYGAVYDGWFYSADPISDLYFAYDNWADLDWTEDDEFSGITTYYHGGTNTDLEYNKYNIGQVNANTWYHFKILYKDYKLNSNSHTYFYSAGAGDPEISDSNFYTEKDLNSTPGVIGRYYKDGTAFEYLTFKNSNLLFMNVDPGLTEAHFPDTLESRNPDLSYNRELKLNVAGDIVLESGGKIDVSGKGYSGGSASRIPNGSNCPPWNEGETQTTRESVYATAGEGPGGGSAIYHCTTHKDLLVAGGGGYGGSGGRGDTDHWNSAEPISGGISYPADYEGDLTDDFEMGSGGGGATQLESGYGVFGRGGAGGGRVSIEANNISFENEFSYIAADGEQGAAMHEREITAHGGGGSGGTIWIKVPDSSSFNGQNSPEVKGSGLCPGCAEGGTINGDEGNNINLKANGGHSGIWGAVSSPFGGGGGGRIVISFPGGVVVPGAPEVRKVRVEVWWKELGQDQHVEFETWLRDVRVK